MNNNDIIDYKASQSKSAEIEQFRKQIVDINKITFVEDVDFSSGQYVIEDENGELYKKNFKPFPSNIDFVKVAGDDSNLWKYRKKASAWKMHINAKIFEEDAEKIVAVKLPSSLQIIEPETFAKCKNLKVVIFNEGLEEIGIYAFANTNLREAEFPHSLISIEEDAFKGCNYLCSVKFVEGLKYLQNGAFAFTAVKTLDLPTTLSSIGDGAFENCKKLTNVTMQYGIENIGFGVFKGCEQLTEAIIPDSVQTLDHHLFNGCTNLKYVALPKYLKDLPYLFNGCTNLQYVRLPMYLNPQEYRYGVFPKCKELIIEGNLPINDDAFRRCEKVYKYNDELSK